MVSDEWLQEYIDREVERPLSSSDTDPVLADRMRIYLRLGLQRLNALPSEDPFWINTNGKPTLFKLHHYFTEKQDSDEDLWILASVLLLYCADGQLGYLLKPLLDRDLSNVEWVMAAGRWVRQTSGFSARSSLRDLLVDLRTRLPELTARLEALRQGVTAHQLRMIDEALDLNSPEWTAALTDRWSSSDGTMRSKAVSRGRPRCDVRDQSVRHR
jgi:hypothetical protein